MHETIVPERYREQHIHGMRHFLSTGEGPALNTRIEISALHRDGREFPVELSISPIRTGGSYEFSSFIRDISERKRMEQQLTEREKLFRAIFEQAPNGVELIDPETLRFVEANPAACRMLGYTHEEYLQLRLADTQAMLQGESLLAAVRQVEESGGMTFESRHRCKNGSILDVEVTARVLNVPGKRLLVGVWRNITESKQAEAAIRESETKYRELFESAGDGIFIQDANGFIDCNEKGASMYGMTRAEVIGRHPATLAPEKQPNGQLSADFAAKEIAAALSGKPQQFEWRALRADGFPLDVEITLSRIEFGGAVCLQAVVRDISARKRAEEQKEKFLSLLNATLESSADAILVVNLNNKWVLHNQCFLDLWHITDEIISSGDDNAALSYVLNQLQYPEAFLNKVRELYATPEASSYDTFNFKDGKVVERYSIPQRIEGKVVGRVWSFRDITERKRAEENLRITASVFDTSQEAILITDAENMITDVNPAFTHITGYSREEVLGRNPKLLSSGRQSKEFYAAMWQSLKQEKAWRGEIWNRRKTGETYVELLSISVICDDDGKVLRHVGVFSDISHIKEHEEALSRVAHYDALTGVPNRVLLVDRMRQAIAQASRKQDMVAVCYLDLDGFKPVNDTLGHEAGDHVLIEIAKRIGNAIRGGETVARLGGDEFVVLLLGLERGDECMATLERLLAAIAKPMHIKGKEITLGASIGVSIYPLDDEDPDILLRHADQAMYVAKQSGKNRFYIYDAALDHRAHNQHELLKSIRHGLEHSQFELYYQPKINLNTKQLVGAEALIRWQHPERGLLAPAEFLRHIENAELEIEIGDWVIATALAQADYWRHAGLDIEVSINISARHLESINFVEKLRQKLAHYPGMQPGRLQIEVLETAALNDLTIVSEIVEACRKFGVSFALDDFGTGYSSLTYLSNLPVDVLKIDQSFVRDMLEDKGDRAIVQGIIALAQAFERQTVAEGIETDAHYQALLDMGCEVGQGYGIARPMPAEELANWHANIIRF